MNTSQLTSVGFPAEYIGDYELEEWLFSPCLSNTLNLWIEGHST